MWKDVFSGAELQEIVWPQVLSVTMGLAKYTQSLRDMSPLPALQTLASQFNTQLSHPLHEVDYVPFDLPSNHPKYSGYQADDQVSTGIDCWADLQRHHLTSVLLSDRHEQTLHQLLSIIASHSSHQIQQQQQQTVVEYEELIYVLFRQMIVQRDVVFQVSLSQVMLERLCTWKSGVGGMYFDELLARVSLLRK